jgi:hypothetical protein
METPMNNSERPSDQEGRDRRRTRFDQVVTLSNGEKIVLTFNTEMPGGKYGNRYGVSLMAIAPETPEGHLESIGTLGTDVPGDAPVFSEPMTSWVAHKFQELAQVMQTKTNAADAIRAAREMIYSEMDKENEETLKRATDDPGK